jgi:histidyl-tRNA synthetase
MTRFSTPRGTHDILPADWPFWRFVTGHAEKVAHLFGYQRIETPILGPTELFARTSGEGSDIVDKEMYSFEDRGGDSLTLRPEGTAPVVRAYLEYGMSRLPQPVKLYYVEPMFRYDRPARGRFREHHQFGCEAIGSEDPYVDVEIMALLARVYDRVGLREIALHVNSIGCRECRPRYVAELVRYFESHRHHLAERDLERLRANPLRILDSKEHQSQTVIEGAPNILDYLCEACAEHWSRVKRGLDLIELPYVVDPRLVRGLDYYTRTAFEFLTNVEGVWLAVGAGGRYDGLAEAIGGQPAPGIGFGMGMERVVMLVKDSGAEVPDGPVTDVFVAHVGDEADDRALIDVMRLREQDIPAAMSFGRRSLKAQMKQANTLGARYAAILGEDEIAGGTVTVRSLDTGEQTPVPESDLAQDIATHLDR